MTKHIQKTRAPKSPGFFHANRQSRISGRRVYIGPDHKVIDMKAFVRSLVQALREALEPIRQRTLTRRDNANGGQLQEARTSA